MKSRTTKKFIKLLNNLPKVIQKLAKEKYDLFKENPHHPVLNFKRLQKDDELCSIRFANNWRALGYIKDDIIYWFWIGPHEEYNNLINQL